MRGAILLYEERVRHGEIIRGMNKIATMLGRLSESMYAVTSRLEAINSNALAMSHDLQRHNDALLRSNKSLIKERGENRQATQELIEQTKLGNYTFEQNLRGQQRMLYYERERQYGNLPNPN